MFTIFIEKLQKKSNYSQTVLFKCYYIINLQGLSVKVYNGRYNPYSPFPFFPFKELRSRNLLGNSKLTKK